MYLTTVIYTHVHMHSSHYHVCVCVYRSEFGNTHLETVSLVGVADAHNQHSDGEPKGIKAYFRVDDSGLLYLDKVSDFLYVYTMCISVW